MSQLTETDLKPHGKYNWKCDPHTKLEYVGKQGSWHQFVKTIARDKVWCEVLSQDLHMLEESK